MCPDCSFITRMFPPMHPWKPQSLWLTATCYHSPCSLLTGLSPLWFRFISQIENETEGTTFWNCLTSKGNHKRYSTALRKMTSTVLLKRGKKTIGSLYAFPRRLFWRRRQPKLSKLSQHFFFDLVRELSGRTSYKDSSQLGCWYIYCLIFSLVCCSQHTVLWVWFPFSWIYSTGEMLLSQAFYCVVCTGFYHFVFLRIFY
jgi:hypothetical protein